MGRVRRIRDGVLWGEYCLAEPRSEGDAGFADHAVMNVFCTAGFLCRGVVIMEYIEKGRKKGKGKEVYQATAGLSLCNGKWEGLNGWGRLGVLVGLNGICILHSLMN